MDPKAAVLLILLCALAITTTEGGIPKCCVATTKNISHKLLLKVEKYEMQRNNGACDINALILHVKGKKICAHPKVKRKLKRIQRRRGGKQKRT